MKRGRYLFGLLILMFLLALTGASEGATPVGLPVALRAANHYLPLYFSGDWKLEDSVVAYDVTGVPAAHILIFKGQKGKKQTGAELVTTIIGANEDMPVFVRCYRGLPELLTEQEALKANLKKQGKGRTLGRLIYVSPTDLRYEILEGEGGKRTGELKGPRRQKGLTTRQVLAERDRRLREIQELKTSGDEGASYLEKLAASKKANWARWKQAGGKEVQ